MCIRISILRLLAVITLLFVGIVTIFSQTLILPEPGSPAWFSWLRDNWEIIALILSELAAVLSKKYSGIIQTIVIIVGRLIKKK